MTALRLRMVCDLKDKKPGAKPQRTYIPLADAFAFSASPPGMEHREIDLLRQGWFPFNHGHTIGMNRHSCSACNMCYPTQIVLGQYKPSKKITAAWQDFSEAFGFKIHVDTRNDEGPSDPQAFLALSRRYHEDRLSKWGQTPAGHPLLNDTDALAAFNRGFLIEFYTRDQLTLLGIVQFGIYESGKDRVAAGTKFIYDPELINRSGGLKPGIAMLAASLEVLKKCGTKEVYMGSVTPEGPLAYKGFFQPNVWNGKEWVSWSTHTKSIKNPDHTRSGWEKIYKI